MVMSMFPLLGLFRLQPRQRPRDLLFLLLHQELLCRVILIVISYQDHQLPLLLQHQPPLSLTLAFFHPHAINAPSHSPQIHTRLLIPLLLLIPRMIHLQYPPHNRRAPKVIHGQIRAPLVLILEEGEAFGFSAFLVADEVDVGGLAVLGEDGQDVAFGEVEGEAADVEVGRVAVVGVPGGFC